MVGLTETEKKLNYQLGQMVGSIIELKWLPTLSTDMLKTNRVIEVTDEADLETHRKWERYEELNGFHLTKEEFNEVVRFNEYLGEKYLPDTVECRFDRITPTDMTSFKTGIEDHLWDCDRSAYRVLDDFWMPTDEMAWCSIIKITRTE
jgi:hypothetical protein